MSSNVYKQYYSIYDCFKTCPKWEKRYIILTSGFIIRYTSINVFILLINQDSYPKGIPIKLEGVFAEKDEKNNEILNISTFRKTYKFLFNNEDEVDYWLEKLKEVKILRGKYLKNEIEMNKEEREFEKILNGIYNSIIQAENMINNNGNLHSYM